MKKIINIIAFIAIAIIGKTQPSGWDITPSETGTHCPYEKRNFSIKVYNVADNNASISYNTSGVAFPIEAGSEQRTVDGNLKTTTITFKGYFYDQNNNQSITFKYKYSKVIKGSKGQDSTIIVNEEKVIIWKRIKSLTFPTQAATVYPTTPPIIAKRCISENIPFSFPNCQFENPFARESSRLVYGSITNYLYKLPQGWQIVYNGVTTLSTGTNQIPAGNNVTLISDLSHGVNGYIEITPLNDCSNVSGQPDIVKGSPTQIPITRPEPILTITNDYKPICVGNSKSYTINGVPAGATIKWNLPANSGAQITTADNISTITVKNLIADAVINLNCSVTHCSPFVYPVSTEVILGKGTPNFMLNNVYFHPSPVPKIPSLIFNLEVSKVPAATGYKVYLNNVAISPQSSAGGYVPPGFVQLGGYKLPKCGVKYNLRIEALTPCGSMTVNSTNFQQKCSGQYQQRYAASAHPTLANTLMVGVRQFSDDEIAKLFFDATTLANEQVQDVRVIDKEGNVVLDVSNIGTQLTNIDLSSLAEGIYNIEVYGNNDYKE